MKKLNRNVGALVTLAVFLVTAFAIAADAGATAAAASAATPPEWLSAVLDLVVSIPVVGPIVVTALKYVGLVAALLTALTTFVHSVSTAVAAVFQAAGLGNVAQKLLKLRDTVYPYLAYLSVYNVQKQAKPSDTTVTTIPKL